MQKPLTTLPKPALQVLLAEADCSQASFARLTGITTRQINAWCRGQAVTPRWALILATTLQQHSPDALTMALEKAFVSIATAAECPPQTSGEDLWRPVGAFGAR